MALSKVNDILIFLSVADCGSFIAGGRKLGLSRSAAGKAVARLENAYGTRLFNRTTRAISLTAEGRDLYARGQAIRTAVDDAEAGLAAEPGEPRGTVRLAVPDAFGRRLLLPVVYRYLEAWPDTQVEMSFSDQMTNLVEDGFDLAFRINVTSPDRGLIARTVLTDEAVLCAAPAYFAQRERPLRAEQLSQHECLFFSSFNERQAWHLRQADGTWVRATGLSRLRVDSGEALRTAALAGLGIALLPAFLVSGDLAAGRLERVLPDLGAGDVTVVALYPHKRHLEARVRHFIDLAAKMLNTDQAKPLMA